ncbi:MAG TPA: CheR family methyltransferase [Candidatus Acidoferrales bacterium]|jgi:chemotaxis protein methyltransferase CheR|nr:CheR family methyltransferase [Candidatus Acidoferrales bacterium]
MAEPITTANGASAARGSELADLELHLLLEAVVRSSGHDFRDYSQSTLKRRVGDRLRVEGVATISALQDRVLHSPEAMSDLIMAMSGGSGRVFGDPGFFRTFRTHIVPLLRTYAFTRVWVPHCARGEDVYSLATVLFEEGLLGKSMIYATDPSEAAIDAAKSATFEVESDDHVNAAYRAAGGSGSLSAVSELKDGKIRFDAELLGRSIILARHSLVTDGALNEFHVIVARGVLPQFNKTLQFRVHGLVVDSLMRLGFLCLGQRESLRSTPYERIFRQLSSDESLFRRMR